MHFLSYATMEISPWLVTALFYKVTQIPVPFLLFCLLQCIAQDSSHFSFNSGEVAASNKGNGETSSGTKSGSQIHIFPLTSPNLVTCLLGTAKETGKCSLFFFKLWTIITHFLLLKEGCKSGYQRTNSTLTQHRAFFYFFKQPIK